MGSLLGNAGSSQWRLVNIWSMSPTKRWVMAVVGISIRQVAAGIYLSDPLTAGGPSRAGSFARFSPVSLT